MDIFETLRASLMRKTQRKQKAFEDGTPAEKSSLMPDSQPGSIRKSGKSSLLLQRISYIGIAFVAVNLLVILVLRPLFSTNSTDKILDSNKPQYLSLLVPSNKESDVELCKTILTAQVLNYPVPTVIGWGKQMDGRPIPAKDHALDKVTEIHRYLQALQEKAEDSIVILLDGPNTWFQLRPDVLLQRYIRITRHANKRLAKTYDRKVTQSVVFATQTECNGRDFTDLACASVPECKPRKGQKARCIGPGAIIGPAKDVRAIMSRAKEMLTREASNDVLKVIGEIYQQQEHQREMLRRGNAKWSKWHGESSSNQTQDVPAPLSGPEIIDSNSDFGIGLDYSNVLGAATTAVQQEVSWNTSDLNAADIKASAPPYWTVSGMEEGLPHGSRWTDVELMTVADTGAAPAMLYRLDAENAGIDHALSEELWPKLWLSKYARALYTAAQYLPATVVAGVVNEHGREQLFWNHQVSMSKAGVVKADGKFSHWQNMCGARATWTEIFRDSKGPWTRTEWF